jgi:hypothetical protein
MQKLTITIALAVITLVLGTTTITTTMQIKPAYSQASHCQTSDFGAGPPRTECITPGQDPSSTICLNTPTCPTSPSTPIGGDNPHQEAGQLIGGCHRPTVNPLVSECTVAHP